MNNIQRVHDMFYGRIDPQIIDDVIFNFGGNLQKATECLLELAPATPIPQSSYRYAPLQYRFNPQRAPARFPPATYMGDFFPPSSYRHPPPPGMGCSNSFGINFNQGRSFQKHSKSRNLENAQDKCAGVSKENGVSNKQQNAEYQRSTIMSQRDAILLIKNYLSENAKILVILRGCPGSGKTTLARQIRFTGVILSTDNFFSLNGEYKYSPTSLSEAHEWNREQAKQSMIEGKNPVIIDNTNIQVWEMLPYAALANNYGYAVEVVEPDVQWRLNPGQLAKKNAHGVKKEKIINMLNRYDGNITGQKLLEMVGGDPKNSPSRQSRPDAEEDLKDPPPLQVHSISDAGDKPLNPEACSWPDTRLKTSAGVLDASDKSLNPKASSWLDMRYGDRSETSADVSDAGDKQKLNQEASSWLNMRYGDRSEISAAAAGGQEWVENNLRALSVGSNKTDGDSWAGECTTVGEWMELGEKTGKTHRTDEGEETDWDEAAGKEDFWDACSDLPAVDYVLPVDCKLSMEDLKLDGKDVGDDSQEGTSSCFCEAKKDAKVSQSADGISLCSSRSEWDDAPSDQLKMDEEPPFQKMDACVGTTDEDLALITKLEENNYQGDLGKFKAVLTPFKVFQSQVMPMVPKRLFRYGLDKSAQTTDSMDDLQLLQLLESCFPDVDPEQVKLLYEEKGHDPGALISLLAEIPDSRSLDRESSDSSEDVCPCPATAKEEEAEVAEEEEEESCESKDAGKMLPLVISQKLGEQLLDLFGRPPDFRTSNNGKGHEVELSFELAHMVYQAWIGKSSGNSSEGSYSPERCDPEIANEAMAIAHKEQQAIIASQGNYLSTKIKFRQLMERFPRVNKEILWNIYEASGYMMDLTAKTLEESPQLMEPVKVAMTDEYAADLEDKHMTMAIEASLALCERKSDSVKKDVNGRDAHSECAKKVKNYEKMFKENIGKAKAAFAMKKYFQAHYYSTVADDWKKRYREERALLAEIMIQNTADSTLRSGSLDLHGLKVTEALQLVSQILLRYGQELAKKKPYLFLITGRGLHSAEGVAKIKPSIEGFLEKNGYNYTVATPGILKVHLGRK